MDILIALLSQEAVVAALAGLAALLLLALAALVRRQLQRVGLQIEAAQLARLKAQIEEGILLARQLYRKAPDGDQRNKAMHATAVEHAVRTAGTIARKVAPDRLDALVHAGVRRLKALL